MLRVYQGWSSNQFTVNASEFTVYWLKLVYDLVYDLAYDLTQVWLRYDSISFFFLNIFFIYITFFLCHNMFSSSLAQSLNIT